MNGKRIIYGLCGLLAAAAFGACCETPKLEGVWTEPVPGMADARQGIALEAGGRAASVGMGTLLYERWERRGDRLILSGRSLGNGVEIAFCDTLEIRELTGDRLSLRRTDGYEVVYERR